MRFNAPDSGYAMAALLVVMSVMSVMLSIALPTWSHMIRREKEEELIFRGEQYARAINQYQRKYANQSPASLDVLVEQRMLRKKFKDPLSPNKDGEFQLLSETGGTPGGQNTGSQGIGSRGTGSQGSPLGGGSQGTFGRGAGPGASGFGPMPSGRGGLIVGVASKNTGQSIRLYKGKNRYNEWQFIGMEVSSRAGGGGPGGAPGERGSGPRRGGPGDRRGGRGGPSGDGTFGPPDGRFPFPPSSRGGRGF